MTQVIRGKAAPDRLARGMAGTLAVGLCAFGAVSIPAAASESNDDGPENVWTLESPDGEVSVTLALDDGALGLAASRDEQRLLDVDRLGVQTSTADLSQDLAVTDASTSVFTDSYTMTTGKTLDREVEQNELRLTAEAAGHAFDVVVRVADDGVAFGYELPDTLGESYTVTGEPATLTVPDRADAWLQPYTAWYENEHISTNSTDAPSGDFGFPATFRTDDDTYVMLTESNVRGTYAGTHLTRTSGTPTYGLGLYEGTAVRAQGALTTPWRVAVLGDADALVSTTIVDDLADPSEVEDTSWIEPGISAWSWMAGGASIERQGDLGMQKQFVDLAARNGWPYALIDGGWQESWVSELTRYADARGVSVLAWFHSNRMQDDAQRQEWFAKLKSWGIAGIKVDFMDSDSQDIFEWYDKILPETAEAGLMINFHGATVPKGMQRTWPHVMTTEGVRGEENGRNANRNTILPFTRNVVGSMDYTPTMFTGNTQTSKAHELALTVLYESGWQHLVDGPEGYGAQPVAERFLQQVPAAWDDIQYVSGSPEQPVALARKSGENWFLGGITGAAADTLEMPLTALGDGEWLVHTITDSGANLVEQVERRTSADTLSFDLPQASGVAVMACPATEGRESCYTSVPRTEVLVDADVSTVKTGDVVTLDGVFVVRGNGPATDVTFDVLLPEGWTKVSGPAVTADSLQNGQTISGSWKVRVGPTGLATSAYLDALASYTTPDGRQTTAARGVALTLAPSAPSGTQYISDLPFLRATTGFGSVTRDVDLNGGAISVGEDPETYEKGIVAHAAAEVDVFLGGTCTALEAVVGVEPGGENLDEASMTFEILGDGDVLETVGTNADPVRIGTAPQAISVDVTGVQVLRLRVGNGGDGINNDHGAFADAKVVCEDAPDPDTSAPEVDVSLSATPEDGWFREPVTVTITATDDQDDAPAVEYALGEDDWQEYTEPVELGEGVHELHARATDNSGNVSDEASSTVQVDVTAPVTSATVDDSERTVTLEASDATSGVARTEYREDDGSWTEYAEPVALGDDAVTVAFRSADNAGNVEEVQSFDVPAAPGTPPPGGGEPDPDEPPADGTEPPAGDPGGPGADGPAAGADGPAAGADGPSAAGRLPATGATSVLILVGAALTLVTLGTVTVARRSRRLA